MKYVRFFIMGILFGIILSKSEVISWFRIQEMFRFQSIHMYGVIGTAVITGILVIQFIKRTKMKDAQGQYIQVVEQEPGYARNLIGGTIFGLGWALTGACPGPLFILLGHQGLVFLIPLAGAVLGTFVYGILRPKLPH
ncbi:MAG: YeeE/YedE family protein [Cyclobacteriaceae bacterium]|nr:YeeE/YedE family protein [Cyclobacteriaceae bacterium]